MDKRQTWMATFIWGPRLCAATLEAFAWLLQEKSTKTLQRTPLEAQEEFRVDGTIFRIDRGIAPIH